MTFTIRFRLVQRHSEIEREREMDGKTDKDRTTERETWGKKGAKNNVEELGETKMRGERRKTEGSKQKGDF